MRLSNGPAAAEYATLPRHKKYPPAGKKAQLRTSVGGRALFDCYHCRPAAPCRALKTRADSIYVCLPCHNCNLCPMMDSFETGLDWTRLH